MTNGIDKTILDRWTGEIMRVHAQLDSQKLDNMRICKEIREPLGDLYEAAKNAGLPSKAFKAHIRAELAKKAYETRLRNIEPEDEDEAAVYEMMREIATPGDLFDTAVKKHANRQQAKSDAMDSLGEDDEDVRPRHLREKDAADDAQVADNVRKLKRGIKPLPEDGAAA